MTARELIDDLLPVLGGERVLFIGEIPGTCEFPQLVADLALNAAVEGQPLVVGLEVPFNEPLDGERWGPFWTRAAHFADGRSSKAMAELVTLLADLAHVGHPVTTVGLDGAWLAPGSEVDLGVLGDIEGPRDEAMAGHLLAALDSVAGAAGLVLAGPEHTGVTRGSGTMGSLVAPWFPGSIALVGLATGGQALTLEEAGPVVRPAPADPGIGEGAVWSDEPGSDGHHGVVNVGIVTPADPFPD
ncbi:MAG: hypothetical protein ACN4GZ_00810 [Acidimicrobiales bacterium]